MLTKKSARRLVRLSLCAGSAFLQQGHLLLPAHPRREMRGFFLSFARGSVIPRNFASSDSGKKTHHGSTKIGAHVIEGPCFGLKHAFEFHSVV
jgi:hypothetical protein